MKNKLESLLGDLMRKIQDVIYARGDANLHAKVVQLEYVTKCWKSLYTILCICFRET